MVNLDGIVENVMIFSLTRKQKILLFLKKLNMKIKISKYLAKMIHIFNTQKQMLSVVNVETARLTGSYNKLEAEMNRRLNSFVALSVRINGVSIKTFP